MKHTLLIAWLVLTSPVLSFAFEPANPNRNPLIAMLSAREIDKELRLRQLYHLAENSDLAERVADLIVDMPTLQKMIRDELDRYSAQHPNQKRLAVEWLSNVVRGVNPDKDKEIY